MLELTKVRSTDGFVDLSVRVPEADSEYVERALRDVLGRLPAEEFEDDKSYTVEEVFGPKVPGRLLRALRSREGITQEELAARLGTTKSVVSNMETGLRRISRKTALKLEELYGTPYKVFL